MVGFCGIESPVSYFPLGPRGGPWSRTENQEARMGTGLPCPILLCDAGEVTDSSHPQFLPLGVKVGAGWPLCESPMGDAPSRHPCPRWGRGNLSQWSSSSPGRPALLPDPCRKMQPRRGQGVINLPKVTQLENTKCVAGVVSGEV